MNHMNLYRSDANWYMRLIHLRTGKVWDSNAGVLSATTSWENSAISLTHSGVIGGHPITLPVALPASAYDILFYSAASPASSNASQVGKRVVWDGSDIVGVPQSL